MDISERLAQQIRFIVEIDRLKTICRRTLLVDRSRLENSAEHSWHMAVMAVLLHEYAADRGVDVLRVVKMALVHDIVEIDAGDTYCYDQAAHADKADREQRAAERLFGLLPEDQGRELRELWDEFEAMATPAARFAAALDRLQPLLNNYHTGGVQWQKHGVTADRVMGRMAPMRAGSETLWEYAVGVIRRAVEEGKLEG